MLPIRTHVNEINKNVAESLYLVQSADHVGQIIINMYL